MSASISREQVADLLLASESVIRALGVARLALFDSVLRGDARPDSDVDLLVQFSLAQRRSIAFLRFPNFSNTVSGIGWNTLRLRRFSPFIGSRILAEAQDVL